MCSKLSEDIAHERDPVPPCLPVLESKVTVGVKHKCLGEQGGKDPEEAGCGK